MAERKRAIQLKFYVTEQEHTLIEEKMKLLQTDNLGAYLRKMAIDGYIIQLDYTAVKEQTAEIQKVGVNVNQIAKRVNSTGNAYKEDLFPLMRQNALSEHVHRQKRIHHFPHNRKSAHILYPIGQPLHCRMKTAYLLLL